MPDGRDYTVPNEARYHFEWPKTFEPAPPAAVGLP